MIKHFPHYSDAAKRTACTLLTEHFGDTGYAFWFRLLEYLNQNNADPVDLNDDKRFFAFALYVHPTERDPIHREDKVRELLDFCATYKDDDGEPLIDAEMWAKQRRLWSRKNRDNVDTTLKRRKNYKVTVDKESPEYRLASRMFEDISNVYPANKRFSVQRKETAITTWSREVLRLKSKYNSSFEEMGAVWVWLHTSKHNDAVFWRGVIRSAAKFSQHFDVLLKKSQIKLQKKPDIFSR